MCSSRSSLVRGLFRLLEMANRYFRGGSAAQSHDRGKGGGGGGKGCSIPCASTCNEKRSTLFQKEGSNVSVPIRSAAERWNTLIRSGLVRGGNTAASSASSAPAAALATLPSVRLPTYKSSSENREWKATSELSTSTAKADAGSTTGHPELPSARQEKAFLSSPSPGTPGLQTSTTAAAENTENPCLPVDSAVAPLPFPRPEGLLVASCDRIAEAEAAATASAFLASSGAVPPQLLALLGTLAGIPFSGLPTACLSCPRRKKKDTLNSGIASKKLSPIAAVPAARNASSIALSAAGLRERVFPEELSHTPQIQQSGEKHLREVETFVSSQRATTATGTRRSSESLLRKLNILPFAKADNIVAINICQGDAATPEQSAAAKVGVAEKSFRAASLPRERSATRSSSAAYNEEFHEEATPVDLFSAALWRTVSCRPAETLTGGKNDLLQVSSHVNVDTENVFAAGKRRCVEQRDARLISGSIRAALAAVRTATARQISHSTALAVCSRMAANFFVPKTVADEEGCPHLEAGVVPQGVFCLPCAVRRHRYCKVLASSSHSFAAACLVMPRSRRRHFFVKGRLGRSKVNDMRCVGEEAEGQHSANICACSSNSASTRGRARRHSVERRAATALLRPDDCAAREMCCCCRSGGAHGSFCCLEKDQSWTCRAVYIHLGMLYTAADVAASATAAAAGKSQRQAKTTAAVTRAKATAEVTASPPALGSVLLKRALLSSLLESLRSQLLLQRQQLQQTQQDFATFNASDSEPVRTPDISEGKALTSLPGAQAARARQDREDDLLRTPCVKGDVSGDAKRESEGLLSNLWGNQLQEEERELNEEGGSDSEADETEFVTICCFGGIEQLQLCQWRHAVPVLNSILPEIAAAAAIQIEQERQMRKIKRTIAFAERGNHLKRMSLDTISPADINLRPTPYTAESRTTAGGTVTATATLDCPSVRRVASATRVLLLLLWKQSQVEADEPGHHTNGAAAAKESQKDLWEDVILWQQQVQGVYPGVQVLLVSDEESLEANAFSNMLQYLTKGSNRLRIKDISRDVTQQQLLHDAESAEQHQVQHLHKPKWRPHYEEPETESQYDQGQNAQCRDQPQTQSPLQDSQWQRQQTPQHPSVERLPKVEQGRRANQPGHKELNDKSDLKICGDAGTVQVVSVTNRRKKTVHTDAANDDACRTKVKELVAVESATSECKWQHLHDGSDHIRERDVQRRTQKTILRPCMLFLCGHNFMAAPLLSEGRSWRQVMSRFPKPLQEFVRELEERVYIPMVLRSRFVAGNGSRVAIRRIPAATSQPATVAAAPEGKIVRLQRQCERLLRWGDELFPPPRVLVHSCDVRGRCRCSPKGTVSQRQRDSERNVTVPLDGGLSPQQLLQLIGERYSREVQTFLLPVAALASSFVGQTEEKLRRLLREAAAAAPAVLILLGLDYLAARRRLHNLATYKRRATAHTRQQQEHKPPANNARHERHGASKPRQEHRGEQTWKVDPQHEREEFHTQTERNYLAGNSAAEDVNGNEERVGQLRPARRVVSGKGYSGEQVGEVRQKVQTACCTSGLSSEGLTSGRETRTAGSTETTKPGDNKTRPGVNESAESETEGDDEETEEEEFKVGNRRTGTGATSSLRRRLLAALLVGLDEVEDRRSCSSALSAGDDDATAVEETDGEVAAEAKLERQWHLQQAGLAVVGVCGGHPEGLDEAVVRAGRLDVWLSWPQCPTRKGQVDGFN